MEFSSRQTKLASGYFGELNGHVVAGAAYQIARERGGNAVGGFLLNEVVQLVLVDIALIAERKSSAARELDVEVGAENEVTDNTDYNDAEGNAEENLLLAGEVKHALAAVVLLSDFLGSHKGCFIKLCHSSHLHITMLF